MRKLKYFVLSISLVLFLLLICNSKKIEASSEASYKLYSDYYENSDLIYNMEDKNNISPYLVDGKEIQIDEYCEKLFTTGTSKSFSQTRLKVYNDDPIVNIIPRELFTSETEFKISAGSEYIYAIETEYIDYRRSPYYESHVMVIDIDNNIEDNNSNIENDLIKIRFEKLFEYKYITLLKEYDYGCPESLRDTVDYSPYIEVCDYEMDDIVIALPTNNTVLNLGNLMNGK